MIIKILIIDMFIIVIFIYLVILGVNKTAEEIEKENKEQIEYLKNYNCRRQKNDRQN